MPRKLIAAEHLESYLADVAARKVESGARRRISYGDGLYLFITGPRSCRWRYDYRHRGVLTSSFWPAIGVPSTWTEPRSSACYHNQKLPAQEDGAHVPIGNLDCDPSNVPDPLLARAAPRPAQ